MEQKTLEAGSYFLGMQAAGLGTRNIAHGPEITTVCYETEKPSRHTYIFGRGALWSPMYCVDVRDMGTSVAHG